VVDPTNHTAAQEAAFCNVLDESQSLNISILVVSKFAVLSASFLPFSLFPLEAKPKVRLLEYLLREVDANPSSRFPDVGNPAQLIVLSKAVRVFFGLPRF
jgi:hypothetical protein